MGSKKCSSLTVGQVIIPWFLPFISKPTFWDNFW